MKISAVIITLNEEANIAEAIGSLSCADEIIVVDSGSSDATTTIAESLGARIIHREWTGFSDQKQFGADAAAHDWVLSLDADERVSKGLALEIEKIKLSESKMDAYAVPRLSTYMGREIRHSGWYPDRQVRLFDRRSGKWNGRIIHESFAVNDVLKVGTLTNDLLHCSVTSAANHHSMIGERYAPLAARHAFENGRTASVFKVVFSGPAAFIRSYFLKLGFLDGFPGFCIARFAAYHAYLKQLMLWELQNGKDAP